MLDGRATAYIAQNRGERIPAAVCLRDTSAAKRKLNKVVARMRASAADGLTPGRAQTHGRGADTAFGTKTVAENYIASSDRQLGKGTMSIISLAITSRADIVAAAAQAANHAIHDLATHVHLSHWHSISTAPCNQDVELRLVEEGKIVTLQFPCRQLNAGEWIDADLGTRIQIAPVEWRVWQKSKSPQPHRSPVQINNRSAMLHTRRLMQSFASSRRAV